MRPDLCDKHLFLTIVSLTLLSLLILTLLSPHAACS